VGIATDVRENVKGLTVPKPNAHNRNYKAKNVRWRRLRWVALLLRRDRIGPGRNMAAFKLLLLTSPA
jgi:hypothetical protein